MKISDTAASTIQKIGIALLVVGGVLFLGAITQFERMPNFLRIAAMLPAMFGVPMSLVNTYRSGLKGLGPRERGWAIAWLLVPLMGVAAAVWWYLSDPTARA